MQTTPKHQPKARIATVVVIAALAILATPIAAADNEPEVTDDGVKYGPCAGVHLGQFPPSYYVDVSSCFPG